MCEINSAFKKMIEDTHGMTYQKLAMMIGEENWKKLQALFDPDREDRPFQMKHMVPTMAACNNTTPLELMAAHFGGTIFWLETKASKLNAQAVLDLLTETTGAGNAISRAIDPSSPGGRDLTRDERHECLKKALAAMSVLMGIVNTLQADE